VDLKWLSTLGYLNVWYRKTRRTTYVCVVKKYYCTVYTYLSLFSKSLNKLSNVIKEVYTKMAHVKLNLESLVPYCVFTSFVNQN